MAILLVLLFLGGIAYVIYQTSMKKPTKVLVDTQWVEATLLAEVPFYAALSESPKKVRFLERVMHFIQTTRFTDIGKAKHQPSDEVLIAASAMIPLYHFPDWDYFNLDEVLLYADAFNEQFQTDEDHPILGMVGEGALERTLLLSLKTLREGFQKKDGQHTPIHEFVHLIDKMDGSTDGVPEYLIPKTLVEPWLRQMRAQIKQIKQGDSNINPYAATNEAEFFAVAAEYFFEKPDMLKREHPVLYMMLDKIFKGV